VSAVVNGRSLGVQYHAPQCARGRILPPSHGSRKNELKEEYPENNYRKNIARTWKWLTATAHTNSPVSGLRNREAIPETLPICIPPCVSPECDARTCNMFGYFWSVVFGCSPAGCQRLPTIDRRPFATSNHLFPAAPDTAPSPFLSIPIPCATLFTWGSPRPLQAIDNYVQLTWS
jgi:hypothetical protein